MNQVDCSLLLHPSYRSGLQLSIIVKWGGYGVLITPAVGSILIFLDAKLAVGLLLITTLTACLGIFI